MAKRDGIGFDVKVARVGQEESQCIANAPRAVDDAFDNRRSDSQLARVVGRSNPKAADFRAELVADFLRRDSIALTLTHLLAVLVEEEPVR